MIRKFIWAVIKLAKKYLGELAKAWLRHKLRKFILYAGGIIMVLLALIILATVL